MLRKTTLLMSVALICGCDATPVEVQRTVATACLAKVLVLGDRLPVVRRALDHAYGEGMSTMHLPRFPTSLFRSTGSGHFIVIADPYRLAPDVVLRINCAGDLKTKRFTSVEVNGKLYEPEPGEIWSADLGPNAD